MKSLAIAALAAASLALAACGSALGPRAHESATLELQGVQGLPNQRASQAQRAATEADARFVIANHLKKYYEARLFNAIGASLFPNGLIGVSLGFKNKQDVATFDDLRTREGLSPDFQMILSPVDGKLVKVLFQKNIWGVIIPQPVASVGN